MLNLLGVEMLFFFKIATVFSLAKLSISAIKLFQGKSIYKTDDVPLFVEKTFKIIICIASSMVCIMFTAFASWTIKFIFIGFFSIFTMLSMFLKNSHFKIIILLLFAFADGIILAKWYQSNPLEGKFGDNDFLESIGIILSSVILIFSINILKKD
jgi:hypothetical protein